MKSPSEIFELVKYKESDTDLYFGINQNTQFCWHGQIVNINKTWWWVKNKLLIQTHHARLRFCSMKVTIPKGQAERNWELLSLCSNRLERSYPNTSVLLNGRKAPGVSFKVKLTPDYSKNTNLDKLIEANRESLDIFSLKNVVWNGRQHNVSIVEKNICSGRKSLRKSEVEAN